MIRKEGLLSETSHEGERERVVSIYNMNYNGMEEREKNDPTCAVREKVRLWVFNDTHACHVQSNAEYYK